MHEDDAHGAAAPPANGDLAKRLQNGDSAAEASFFSEVYAELRRIAEAYMSRQQPTHTLQPTALVNEVYLKLADRQASCTSTEHFLSLAARAMRQVLVDHARRRRTQRRSPDGLRVPLDTLVDAYEEHTGDILELEEVLGKIESFDPELVQMIELRYYSGHTTEEIAKLLGRSVRDVERRWQATRRILERELRP